SLLNSQNRMFAAQTQSLHQSKGRPYGSYFKPDFNVVGLVSSNRVLPRQQQNLSVLPDLRLLMDADRSTIRKQLLPSALIVVGVSPVPPGSSRQIVSAIAQSQPTAPHEIDVKRFIKKLVNVGSLVRKHGHA